MFPTTLTKLPAHQVWVGWQWGGTFTWLTEGEAAHLLSGGERCDPLLFLFFCTKLQYRPDVERLRVGSPETRTSYTPGIFTRLSLPTDCTHVVNRDHDASAGAASADLLHSQTVRQVVHPSPTQLLWHLHGHHPHRPQLLNLDQSIDSNVSDTLNLQ